MYNIYIICTTDVLSLKYFNKLLLKASFRGEIVQELMGFGSGEFTPTKYTKKMYIF